jgi:His/Glu/Gln/Arg/opine family amino acid ABC transporter permease subunit
MQWNVVPASMPYLLQGIRATLLLSATVLVTGTALGALWGLLRVCPVPALQRVMTAIIEGVRSIPLLLQMFFIFFGLPALGVQMPVFLSAALAMTLWMGANLAEVIRGAVESIPRGQLEAAFSTGLTYTQAMRRVILPQALRRMLPPFVGLCTILIKDTSLAAIIGVFELTRAAQETIERTFRSFELYLVVAGMYFVVCFALTSLSRVLERSLGSPGRDHVARVAQMASAE